jgi:hypothetical protein
MAVALADVLLIPYGIAEWSPDGISLEGFSGRILRLSTAFPCAAVNRARGEPLRFNNSRYDLASAPNPEGASMDVRDVLKYHLKSLCRAWDNLSTRFLDGYFEFLTDTVEGHRDALVEQLAPYAGLYDYRDWFFSAPKPLPRAHLYAPAEGSTAQIATADFVPVDFAFWLGDRLVAAQSPQGSLTPKRGREQSDRLRLAGIDLFSFGLTDLTGQAARDFFMRVLGSSVPFWEGEPLPSGPFRAPILEE